MFIQVIEFEIRNFATGTSEEFAVESTADNFEAITRHRFTRAIHVSQMFDFEFAQKEKAPKFIQFSEAVWKAYDNNREYFEMDLDEVDEMVGTY